MLRRCHAPSVTTASQGSQQSIDGQSSGGFGDEDVVDVVEPEVSIPEVDEDDASTLPGATASVLPKVCSCYIEDRVVYVHGLISPRIDRLMLLLTTTTTMTMMSPRSQSARNQAGVPTTTGDAR